MLTNLFPTPVGRIASIAYQIQLLFHRRNLVLVDRLSDFLPIGGICTLVQLILLVILKLCDVQVYIATMVAVEISLP